MRRTSVLALVLVVLAAACSAASPTMPSEVTAPTYNSQGGNGNGDG